MLSSDCGHKLALIIFTCYFFCFIITVYEFAIIINLLVSQSDFSFPIMLHNKIVNFRVPEYSSLNLGL